MFRILITILSVFVGYIFLSVILASLMPEAIFLTNIFSIVFCIACAIAINVFIFLYKIFKGLYNLGDDNKKIIEILKNKKGDKDGDKHN